MTIDERVKEAIQAAVRLRLIRGPQMVIMIMHTMNRIGWRPSDLVQATDLSSASVGMILHDYAKKGMVQKHDLFRDRRSGRYHLTEKGVELAADLWKALWRLNDVRSKHYRMPLPD